MGPRQTCCTDDASQLRCTTSCASVPFKNKFQTKLGPISGSQGIGNQAVPHPGSSEGLSCWIARHMSPELQQYSVPADKQMHYINYLVNARCPYPACSAMCLSSLPFISLCTSRSTLGLLREQVAARKCKKRHAHAAQLPSLHQRVAMPVEGFGVPSWIVQRHCGSEFVCTHSHFSS